MAISHADLKRLLRYDPESGEWERLVAFGGRHIAGTKVGTVVLDREGRPYNIAVVKGRRYKLARLAVFYMRRRWPKGVVDHRDGDTLNDRWRNLRDCSQAQNSCNKKLYKNNKSGHKGVYWLSSRQRWVAAIYSGRQRKFLGYFKDVGEAGKAYQTAAAKHFGEFARA